MTGDPVPIDFVYRNLSRESAETHFRERRATEAERLEEFVRSVAARGVPALDFSRDSLLHLGAWILDALEDGPRGDDIPIWARRKMPPFLTL